MEAATRPSRTVPVLEGEDPVSLFTDAVHRCFPAVLPEDKVRVRVRVRIRVRIPIRVRPRIRARIRIKAVLGPA